MKTAQEKLAKLREHNTAMYRGDKVGTLKKTEVQEAIETNLENFSKEVIQTRQGRVQDRHGRHLPAYDVSFAEALTDYFGIQSPDKDRFGVSLTKKQKEVAVIRQFLRQMDVSLAGDTLASTAQRFGNSNLTATSLQNLMVAHSQFDALNNTSQIPSDYRFIIAELVLAAIRLDYEGGSQHNNWIAQTVNISQTKVTMPQIKRGAAVPRKIGEAESIPFGTVRFGKKDAEVFKVGIGFKITDELVEASTLDMMFEFLGEVGTEMSIAADVQASTVLLNGEQASLAESAPVIGVETTNQFKFKDLKRGISRLTRLKRNVSRILTSETDGIDLSLLDEFKGFSGDTRLANLNSILGVPASLANDVFVLPSNQILLLAPSEAMFKLQYRSMKTEERRNPQTQETELFVSDYIGFAIKRRDGRLLIDKSLAFSGNGFPSYMDIDTRISTAFKNLQE